MLMSDYECYTKEELRKLQRVQTKMLKYIDEFCENNNIEYFIVAGTVLGAVRHGGFIPWDDDIDIGMTRENYEKFIDIASKEMKGPYFLQCLKTEPNTPYVYAKVRLDNSMFVEYCNRNVHSHKGIYIDVFPYDNTPDDRNEYAKWFAKLQKMIRIFAYTSTPDISEKPNNFKQEIKSIIRRMIHIIFKCVNKKKLFNKIHKEFIKYNNEETKAISCGCFPEMYRMYSLRETVFPLKKIKFEDIYVYAPKDEDLYLTNMYGNYMEMPPTEKRVGHRPYKFKLPDNY